MSQKQKELQIKLIELVLSDVDDNNKVEIEKIREQLHEIEEEIEFRSYFIADEEDSEYEQN